MLFLIVLFFFFQDPAKAVQAYFRFGVIPQRLWAIFDFAWSQKSWTALFIALGNLATAIFFHGGPEHLVNNLVFLWIFGALLETLMGRTLFLLIFILGGMLGNLFQSFLFAASLAPVIGASGGIAALEGAYLGLSLRLELPWPYIFPMSRPIPPWQLAIMGLIGLYLDTIALISPSRTVAYGAHIGGFLSGFAMGLCCSFLKKIRQNLPTPV